MTTSMRTVTFGLRAALAIAVAAAALAFAAAHVQAATSTPRSIACSSRGLSPTRKQDGVTEQVTVSKLRVTAIHCSGGRAVAHSAALALLDHGRVPRRIYGYVVRSTAPCAACTPQRTVTATASRGRRITFVLFG